MVVHGSMVNPSTKLPASSKNAMSNGMSVFFIQKPPDESWSKMNTIPSRSPRSYTPIRPSCRNRLVSATATRSSAPSRRIESSSNIASCSGMTGSDGAVVDDGMIEVASVVAGSEGALVEVVGSGEAGAAASGVTASAQAPSTSAISKRRIRAISGSMTRVYALERGGPVVDRITRNGGTTIRRTMSRPSFKRSSTR